MTKDHNSNTPDIVVELNDENREEKMREIYGDLTYDYLVEEYGEPHRVTAIVYIEERPILAGDCPCEGEKCRAAWGWTWKSMDLNLSGHRGSLWAEVCKSMPKTVFLPDTGEFTAPPPYAMDAKQFVRFLQQEWGTNISKADIQLFTSANVASAENRKSYGSWKVDS